jgi:hypothetical protein
VSNDHFLRVEANDCPMSSCVSIRLSGAPGVSADSLNKRRYSGGNSQFHAESGWNAIYGFCVRA